jgi:hypothetical protein
MSSKWWTDVFHKEKISKDICEIEMQAHSGGELLLLDLHTSCRGEEGWMEGSSFHHQILVLCFLNFLIGFDSPPKH